MPVTENDSGQARQTLQTARRRTCLGIKKHDWDSDTVNNNKKNVNVDH